MESFTVETLQEGDGINFPKKGFYSNLIQRQKVYVHYTGRLKNGKKFDTSRDGEPFAFTLGAGKVIKGWEQGVAQMSLGQKVRLTCPPDFAYGKRGCGSDIPPNTTLYFEVDLLSFK